MTEELSKFSFLRVTPPLLLKEIGHSGPLPVLLSEGTALSTIKYNYVVMYVYTMKWYEMLTVFLNVNDKPVNSQLLELLF